MAESLIPSTPELPEGLRAALARLDGLVDWERRDRSGPPGRVMRVDLGPMRDLMARLAHPESQFPAVHVAGTKGKGSVASLVAAGLSRLGLAVGVYASPHVERIHERITLEGRPIDDVAFQIALEQALEARDAALRTGSDGVRATWFDVLTAAAFVALAARGVDIALVECGLGGRLDSTNVLPPGPCVFTSIDLEHTAILGTTLAEIAGEKAGILKPGATAVSGVGPPGDEAAELIASRARELGVPLRRVEIPPEDSIEARNVRLAGAVLDELGEAGLSGEAGTAGAWLLDPSTVDEARLPGRLECLRDAGRWVVLDGAHVPSSVELLLRDLAGRAELAGKPVCVLGLGREKDARGVLKAMRGRVDRLICTRVGSGPSSPPQMLVDEAQRIGIEAEGRPSPEEAYALARDSVRGGGWVLVTGSLHLAGALRSRIAGS